MCRNSITVSVAISSAILLAACGTTGTDSLPATSPVTPGALIESSPLPPGANLPIAGESFQIVYGTTTQSNTAATSSGAVFLPSGPSPDGGWPVVAWAHGTVGLGDGCAPSTKPRSKRDAQYLTQWLNSGYAVVSTDYIGIGTPGVMSYINQDKGNAVTDSVRAAHELGAPLADKWAVVGQSQGASASLATAFDAERRAPNLDFRGAIATGIPAGVPQTVLRLTPDLDTSSFSPSATSYLAYYLATIRENNPNIDLPGVLTPRGEEVLDLAKTMCLGELTDRLRDEKPSSLVNGPLAGVAGLSEYLDKMFYLNTEDYPAPLFLAQGTEDKDAQIRFVDKLVAKLKSTGNDVEYHRYPDTGHSETVLATAHDAEAFVDRVMNR